MLRKKGEILKEKKICQSLLKNTQELLILNWSFQKRSMSKIYKVFFPELDTRVFSYHPSQEQNLATAYCGRRRKFDFYVYSLKM